MNERALAKEIGVSPTTLLRVKRGELLDYKSMKKVCGWLGIEIPLPVEISFGTSLPISSGNLAGHILVAQEKFNCEIKSVSHDD
jgi:transcriptional regulator with XRE-family HTH domain